MEKGPRALLEIAFAAAAMLEASSLGARRDAFRCHRTEYGRTGRLGFAARYHERVTGVVVLEAFVAASDKTLAGLRGMLEGLRVESYHNFAVRLLTHLLGPSFDPEEGARMLAIIASCPQHVLPPRSKACSPSTVIAPQHGSRVRFWTSERARRTPMKSGLAASAPQLLTERLVGRLVVEQLERLLLFGRRRLLWGWRLERQLLSRRQAMFELGIRD